MIAVQQEQLNNIFMSQADGVLVYNIEDEAHTEGQPHDHTVQLD